MTREEHIIYVKNLRMALKMTNSFSIKTMESLDAAIKALEQEPKVNNITIPQNATNGDMIEAMFPNLKGREKAFEIELNVNKNKVGDASVKWWNAPYKYEVSE